MAHDPRFCLTAHQLLNLQRYITVVTEIDIEVEVTETETIVEGKKNKREKKEGSEEAEENEGGER